MYEDDASQDKSHSIQQTVDDDGFESIPFCLQVCSASNHAPWIIQRTVARFVLLDFLSSFISHFFLKLFNDRNEKSEP